MQIMYKNMLFITELSITELKYIDNQQDFAKQYQKSLKTNTAKVTLKTDVTNYFNKSILKVQIRSVFLFSFCLVGFGIFKGTAN